MAFTTPTDDIIAELTDSSRNGFARSVIPAEAYAFKLIGFTVGRDGYQIANPVKVSPIVPALSNLVDPVFPTIYGPSHVSFIVEPFEFIEEIISPEIIAPICRLAPTDFESNYGLGELGVWAEVVRFAVGSEVGTKFLFAVAHFPLLGKTQSHTLIWRVILAL
jgi:hypothetical protein